MKKKHVSAVARSTAALILAVVIAVAGVGVGLYYASLPPTVTPTTILTTAVTTAVTKETVTVTTPITPTKTVPTEGPILIGWCEGLTGPAYYAATINYQAINLAAQMINEKGGVLGREIELRTGDDEGSPAVGVSVFERLITESGVVAFCGGYYSYIAMAEIEVVHDYKIPWVAAGPASDRLRELKYPEFFAIVAPTSVQGRPTVEILEHLYNQGKVKSVAVIAATDEYDQILWTGIKKGLDRIGIEYRVDMVDLQTEDFTSLLLSYKAEPRPDALVTLVAAKGVMLIPKQAKEVGLAPTPETPYVIDADGNMVLTAEFWDIVGDAGLYWTSAAAIPMKYVPLTPLGQEFADRYEETYGHFPPNVAFDNFDSLWALAQAMELAGSTDPQKVISALEQLHIKGSRDIDPTWLEFPTEVEEDWMYHNCQRDISLRQAQEVNSPVDDWPIVWPPELAQVELITP